MTPLVRLIPFFGGQVPRLLRAQFALLMSVALGLVGPALVAKAIDEDIQRSDMQALLQTAGLYFAVVVLNLLLNGWARMEMELSAQAAMVRIKATLFDHLLHHDVAFLDRHPSGRLVTRIQGDTEALRLLLTEVILCIPSDLAFFVGIFVVLGVYSPQIAWVVALVIPFYVMCLWLFRRFSPPLFLALRGLQSGFTGFAAEAIRAMEAVQFYGQTSWAEGQLDQMSDQIQRTDVQASFVSNLYGNSIFMVRSLGFVAVLAYGAGLVSTGQLEVGALVMAMGYLRQMFNLLMRISFNLTTVERANAAAIRMGELLDTTPKVVDPPAPQPWPGVGEGVRLTAISFGYLPDQPVLHGLDLLIPAGAHIGIAGTTGSGKSTIVNLLMRFADPDHGAITIAGVDLRHLSRSALRQHVGLVSQDVLLIPGTVLDNLGGEPLAAQRALARVGLTWSLDTPIEEGGKNLSRGERQLLTFARALLTDPPIIILDEATSAMDPATEDRIQACLMDLRGQRTLITVAHRLRTLRRCDMIYVLHAGRWVESGEHAALLAKGGVYASMVSLQSAEV